MMIQPSINVGRQAPLTRTLFYIILKFRVLKMHKFFGKTAGYTYVYFDLLCSLYKLFKGVHRRRRNFFVLFFTRGCGRKIYSKSTMNVAKNLFVH